MIIFTMVDNLEDRNKLEEIYIKYKKLMYYIAMDVLDDTHESEDVVQNSIIKIANILPVVGILLYLIAVSFVVFAFNYPQGGFPFPLEITYLIYISYLIIMFSSLIKSSVLLSKTKFDNKFQKLGSKLFTAGVLLSIIHFIMFYIFLYSSSNFLLADIMGLSILYPIISLILLIVGISLTKYPLGSSK